MMPAVLVLLPVFPLFAALFHFQLNRNLIESQICAYSVFKIGDIATRNIVWPCCENQEVHRIDACLRHVPYFEMNCLCCWRRIFCDPVLERHVERCSVNFAVELLVQRKRGVHESLYSV